MSRAVPRSGLRTRDRHARSGHRGSARPATCIAVLLEIAKAMPCAGLMTAVFTPMTCAAVFTSGPPELPGLRAASVCTTSSTSRPAGVRSDRPTALTTPDVTVWLKPSGLPTAIAICPTRMCRASAKPRQGSPVPGIDSTARSVSGSRPTTSARWVSPSAMVTSTKGPPWMTCAFVRTRPSGVKRKPEPEPAGSRASADAVRAPPRAFATSTRTTAGATRATVSVTACEYASSRGAESICMVPTTCSRRPSGRRSPDSIRAVAVDLQVDGRPEGGAHPECRTSPAPTQVRARCSSPRSSAWRTACVRVRASSLS